MYDKLVFKVPSIKCIDINNYRSEDSYVGKFKYIESSSIWWYTAWILFPLSPTCRFPLLGPLEKNACAPNFARPPCLINGGALLSTLEHGGLLTWRKGHICVNNSVNQVVLVLVQYHTSVHCYSSLVVLRILISFLPFVHPNNNIKSTSQPPNQLHQLLDLYINNRQAKTHYHFKWPSVTVLLLGCSQLLRFWGCASSFFVIDCFSLWFLYYLVVSWHMALLIDAS